MVNEPVRFSPFPRTACSSRVSAASSCGLDAIGGAVLSEAFFATSPISSTVGFGILFLGELVVRLGDRGGSARLVGLAIFVRRLALAKRSRNSLPNRNVIGLRISSLPFRRNLDP